MSSKKHAKPAQSAAQYTINSHTVQLLLEHGFDINNEHIGLIQQIRNQLIAIHPEDQKELQAQLIDNWKRLDNSLKKHISSQDIIVIISALAWLTFKHKTDTEFRRKNSDQWLLFIAEKDIFELTDGSLSSLTLSNRLYLSLIDLPNATLTALNFGSTLLEKSLSIKNAYATTERFEAFLEHNQKALPIFDNKHSEELNSFFYFLERYLSKEQPNLIKKVILITRAIDYFWGSSKSEKGTLFSYMDDWHETVCLDFCKISQYKNPYQLYGAAAKALDIEGSRIKNKMSIIEEIDQRLIPDLTNITARKKIYRDIDRNYTKSNNAALLANPSKTLTLTDDEYQLIQNLEYITDLSPTTLIKESLHHALQQYKTEKKNPTLQQITAQPRQNTSRTSFRLDENSRQLLKDLVATINKSKIPTPRKPNDSLAVGIAIRLYAQHKQHKKPSFIGTTPVDPMRLSEALPSNSIRPRRSRSIGRVPEITPHPSGDQPFNDQPASVVEIPPLQNNANYGEENEAVHETHSAPADAHTTDSGIDAISSDYQMALNTLESPQEEPIEKTPSHPDHKTEGGSSRQAGALTAEKHSNSDSQPSTAKEHISLPANQAGTQNTALLTPVESNIPPQQVSTTPPDGAPEESQESKVATEAASEETRPQDSGPPRRPRSGRNDFRSSGWEQIKNTEKLSKKS